MGAKPKFCLYCKKVVKNLSQHNTIHDSCDIGAREPTIEELEEYKKLNSIKKMRLMDESKSETKGTHLCKICGVCQKILKSNWSTHWKNHR